MELVTSHFIVPWLFIFLMAKCLIKFHRGWNRFLLFPVSSIHVPSSALYKMNVQHLLPEFLCNMNNDTTIYHMIFNLCVCSADWAQHFYHTEEVHLFLPAFYKFIWGGDSKSFTLDLQQMWRQQLIQYNFVFTNQSAWVLHLYQHFHHFWISLVCMLQTCCWRHK